MVIVNPFCDIDLRADGSQVLTATTAPRYYLDHESAKTWRPIDTTPHAGARGATGYHFAVDGTFARIFFAPRGTGEALARIVSPYYGAPATYTLRVSRLGEAPCLPQVVDAYADSVYFLLDDTAYLQFSARGHKIEKKIVISRRPIWNSVTFEITRSGGALTQQLDGSVLGTRAGSRVLRFSAPSLAQHGVDVMGIPLSVTPTVTTTYPRQGTIEITVHLDDAWMSNALYPVTLDPTITLQPYPDTTGIDTRLVAGGGYNDTSFNDDLLSCVNAVGGLTACSILLFDLSTLPAGSTIDSATLSLWRSAYSSLGNNVVTAQLLTRAWTETQATWNSAKTGIAWGSPGAQHVPSDILAAPAATASIDISVAGARTDWDVAAHVQQIANGMSNNGLRLSPPATAIEWAHMRSSGAGVPSQAPRLIVDYHVASSARPQYLSPFGGCNISRGIA